MKPRKTTKVSRFYRRSLPASLQTAESSLRLWYISSVRSYRGVPQPLPAEQSAYDTLDSGEPMA
jgi:hypothetical protein